ncbi:MAG: transcriptional regulator [Alphaproteobacteria bacterium]|nr:transcriptional regulator [Alphaproteobacteria bacterium]
MTVKPIRTEPDYPAALTRISSLMNATAGTPEGDELDVLVDLVEAYESRNESIGFPDPIAAIEFRMDQAGLSRRDLVPLIGSRAKVAEVLSGKRELTLSMARALHGHLGIPSEVLIRRSVQPKEQEVD